MAENKLELRSEKVRKIIGNIPSGIVRNGTTVIVIIIFALLLAAFYIPYPESVKVKARITSVINGEYQITGYVPYSFINDIKENMSVQVEFEGYNSRNYGFQKGIIHNINKEIITIDGINYFSILVLIKTNDKILTIQERTNGIASILVSNKSIVQYAIEK